jgi:hypothetical protein
MANQRTITSANAVLMLAIADLFPVPQQIQGFMAEEAFDTEDVENKEIVQGVDGFVSVGWVPHLVKKTISIMPDSLSSFMFEDWIDAEDQSRDVFTATGVLTLTGIKREYTLIDGYLSRMKPIPGGKKVLQGRGFVITWTKCLPANI